MRRPALEPLGVLVPVVAALAVLAGQLRTPFHTLGPELSTALTLVVALTLFFVSAARAARAAADSPRRALAGSLLAALAAAALVLALLVPLNALGAGCALWRGVPYLLTTLLPASAFAAVAGTLLGERGTRWRRLLLVAAAGLVLSGAGDVAQLLWGPRAVPVDFFLGELAFGQRSAPEVSGLHLAQRGVLSLVAWTLWQSARWWRGRRAPEPPADSPPAGGQALAGAVLLALAVTLGGSHVGVGWGWGRTLAWLDATRETEHFVFHLEDRPWVWQSYDAIAREAEWSLRYLEGVLGVRAGRPKIHVFVYAGRDSLAELTGVPAWHAKIRQVHATPAIWRDESLLHELVHALHVELDPSPWILLSRGMLEGTARAIETAAYRIPAAHELQAGALAAGSLPPIRSVMSAAGFAELHEYGAYQAAGSFLGWLYLERGAERWLRLQRTFDFEEVYGQDLDALDAAWRAFLATVPHEPGARLAGERLFDVEVSPPYLALDCPKLGSARPDAAALAWRHWLAGEYGEAARLYAALWRRQRRAEHALWAARSLAAGARAADEAWAEPPDDPAAVREALALLREAAEASGIRAHQRARLLEEEIRLLLWLRDWSRLEVAFERREAQGLVEQQAATMAEACLRRPELRDEVARALLADDPRRSLTIYRRLLPERPGFTPLLWLRFAAMGSLPLEQRVEAAAEVASSCADCGTLIGDELQRMLHEAFGARAWEAARSIAELLAERSSDEVDRYRGRLALERLQLRPGTAP